MRTRSPIFLIPMSLRWVWSISIRISPVTLCSATISREFHPSRFRLLLKRSTYCTQLIRLSHSPTLFSSQRLKGQRNLSQQEGTYHAESGASQTSEKSDSVGEAKKAGSDLVVGCMR